MASISAVTFNSGSTIDGTLQVGQLAIGSTPQDYANDPGGLKWWSSADLDSGYIIAHVNPNANQPNSQGITGVKVGFWRTQFTDSDFISWAEYIAKRYHTPETFSTATEANIWLFANGYWTSYLNEPTPTITLTPTSTSTPTPTPTSTTIPSVTPTQTPTPSSTPSLVTSGLIIQLDAYENSSYPGTGTTVYDITGGYNHTLIGATYTVLNGIKCFDCTTGNNRVNYNATGPTLPTSGYTYITWAKLEPGNPSSFRTVLYTKGSPKITPITIPDGTNTLGYWATGFVSSGYDLSGETSVWVQYAVVGTNSSQTFYINGSQVGSTINEGAGGTTHWGWGNNDIVPQPWGYVANMYFYNRQLSLSEITQQYNFLSPRFVEVTPTPTEIPVTPTPTETTTGTTPTPTQTITSTPTETPTPVTGYGYNLVVLPYNPPTSGNTIFPTFASPGLNSGTTNPNTFDINAVYWNSIDNTSVDRTSYYSGMTGVSVTAYFTQNGDTAIYSGSPTAFIYDGPPGQESFNYNPSERPGQLVLVQSASTNFVTGQTVYISYVVNTTVTPTPTPTNTQTSTPTNTVTPTNTTTPTNTNTPTPSPTPNIVTSNLQLQLLPSSYVGSGTVWDTTVGTTDATLSGSPTYNVLSGFTFNGTSSYGRIPSVDGVTNFTNTQQYTIEIWFNPANGQPNAGEAELLEKWDLNNESRYPYTIRFNEGASSMLVAAYDGSNNPSVSIAGFPVNTWRQLVAVFDFGVGKTLTVYRNGVFAGSASLVGVGQVSNTSPVGIAGRVASGTGALQVPFKGTVGTIRMYDTTLTASQVLQNFDADKSMFGL